MLNFWKFIMSHITPTHSANHSLSWGTSNDPYFPKPSNRGACARFRMRRRVSRRHHQLGQPHLPANITAEQLLQVKTKLYQELIHLNEAVLQQAHALNEHVLSCTSMANTITDIFAAGPSHIHPLVASSTPSAYPPPSSISSTSVSAPQTGPTPPHHDSLPETSTGVTSSLPKLRGFFNKSKTKSARGGWVCDSDDPTAEFSFFFFFLSCILSPLLLSYITFVTSSSTIVLCHRW